MRTPIARVEQALADVAAGRSIVLIGGTADQDSYLLAAAEKSSTASIAFMVRHGSGLICAAVTGADADRLGLSPMSTLCSGSSSVDYLVSVDTADGSGTGISAIDRACTLRLLADPHSLPATFTRPGHVMPARAHPGGVLGKIGAAEAATDLTRLAGVMSAGAYTALVSVADETRMANPQEANDFAARHKLAWLFIDDVVAYRRATETAVRATFRHNGATTFGPYVARGFHSDVTGTDFVAYTVADVNGHDTAPQVVRHREDAADVGSLGLADSLATAMKSVARHGHGTVVVERYSERQSLSDNARHMAAVDADVAEIVRTIGYTTVELVEQGERASDAPVVTGLVQHGDQRGRVLGFPTANIELDNDGSAASSKFLADGVWAARCELDDGRTVSAAVSIGRRSTFYGNAGRRLLEAHLLDFTGDLYDRELTVRLVGWIRSQTAFGSKEELIAALNNDVQQARKMLVH
ncbi:3,4-dihydroxy-2-butanone-4-phosphate synthase [Antrihabitans stalactiti]|uniref:Riboflavin biosynthesis protein n=1 Tax=Antrihabitans stalactiti TaxID=2584121 RepID=A0A848KPJ4_9NOCA|nr:3,4-dihydroxy-2-butanone-4-phosphate synthase [Antrihabitans stalactiti]NMN97527.1 riboflavin biosynthesis protein [Antrihabitans stalactiti]